MKKIFTLILLTLALNSYSQEAFIGKTKEEIEIIINQPTKEIIFNNKSSLYIEVDTNISDIYSFNDKNICVEYNRLYSNERIENIENVFLKNFKKSGSLNLWVDDSNKLMAVIKASKNIHQISIKRNKYY